jgi:hypothetical protein
MFGRSSPGQPAMSPQPAVSREQERDHRSSRHEIGPLLLVTSHQPPPLSTAPPNFPEDDAMHLHRPGGRFRGRPTRGVGSRLSRINSSRNPVTAAAAAPLRSRASSSTRWCGSRFQRSMSDLRCESFDRLARGTTAYKLVRLHKLGHCHVEQL